MKTRGLLVAALIIVLLLVYYLVGTGYLKQRNEHRDLVLQVTDTEKLLAQTQPDISDFETRLASAGEKLAAAKEAFPRDLNRTQIINAVLKIAEETGVKAVPVTTQDWAKVQIGGVSYLAFRLNMSITADLEHFSGFLQQLETGEIQTLVVEHSDIEWLNAAPSESEVSDQSPDILASIDIAIYSRSGD